MPLGLGVEHHDNDDIRRDVVGSPHDDSRRSLREAAAGTDGESVTTDLRVPDAFYQSHGTSAERSRFGGPGCRTQGPVNETEVRVDTDCSDEFPSCQLSVVKNNIPGRAP